MEAPTLKELKACQFSSWYPTFRSLNSQTKSKTYPFNNVTIRSIIIKPLPQGFINYLKTDGVILPKGAEKVSSFLPTDTNDDWSSSIEDDINHDQEENDHCSSCKEDLQLQEAHFPQLNEDIQNALDALGGSCMPKLNWSAPKDVTWINESSLKCTTMGDVYLLLKSSDFCMFDLEHALDDVDVVDVDGSLCLEYELILRKWSNLHASMEFRAFVSNHELIAICQRNHTQHYPHLKKEYMQIRSLIVDFFQIFIRENYAGGDDNGSGSGDVPDYVFDVYVDKNGRVWLIDFNLWSERTDALMFTWEEIVHLSNSNDVAEELPSILPSSSSSKVSSIEAKAAAGQAKVRQGEEEDNNNDNEEEEEEEEEEKILTIENTRPEMRVVMNENEVHYDPLSSYRAPIDAVYLASDDTGSENFKEFMAMCEKPSNKSESDD